MSWTFVVLALALFLFAIYIGFLCGQWACEKRVITKRDYWIANFAGAAAVVLLTWVFSLFPLVQFAPIGWLGGFIAGLKMSFGESVGPWAPSTTRSLTSTRLTAPLLTRRRRGTPPCAVAMARPTDSSSRSPMTARVLASMLRNSKKR